MKPPETLSSIRLPDRITKYIEKATYFRYMSMNKKPTVFLMNENHHAVQEVGDTIFLSEIGNESDQTIFKEYLAQELTEYNPPIK